MREDLPKIDTQKIRDSYRISDVAARHTKLTRSGREFKGLCPFHQERTPSFYVVDTKGFAQCFGCGWNGDIIRFVMDADGLSFPDACAAITSGDLPLVDQQALRKAREEDEATKLRAIERAGNIWRGATGLGGTLGEIYLRSRGIRILPPRFRFAMIPAWYDDATGECGPDRPAVVCLVTDAADRGIGIQRIFLAPDGRGKAPDMKVAKLSFGRPRGGAIRLGPAGGDHVIVVEGPEDGATVSQMRADQPVFVTCGTGMMPLVEFPPEIRRVTIGADNGKAGMAAAQKARAAFIDRGLEVRTVYPDPAFSDWNDQLRGVKRT